MMQTGKSSRYLLAGLCALGLLLSEASTARAEFGPFWRAQGDKPGPFMFNMKFGGALGAYYYGAGGYYTYYYRGPDFFVLQTEAGFAVTQDKNGYLIAPIQFELTPGLAVVMLPFGFQYDIPLPLKGLYLTPRISGGYAAWVYQTGWLYGPYGRPYAATEHTGFLMPEFGAKYVLKGRLNFGIEPFSLPIFFGAAGAAIQYRILLYGGINL